MRSNLKSSFALRRTGLRGNAKDLDYLRENGRPLKCVGASDYHCKALILHQEISETQGRGTFSRKYKTHRHGRRGRPRTLQSRPERSVPVCASINPSRHYTGRLTPSLQTQLLHNPPPYQAPTSQRRHLHRPALVLQARPPRLPLPRLQCPHIERPKLHQAPTYNTRRSLITQWRDLPPPTIQALA